MILPDTSAWVEYDRATGSRVHRRLRELIDADAPLAITEPVMMEVLAGARDDAGERDLRRLLLRFELLPFESPTDFDAAVRIYRLCRERGVTPRGLVDCMVVALATRTGVSLLAADADFAHMAGAVALQLDEATPTA